MRVMPAPFALILAVSEKQLRFRLARLSALLLLLMVLGHSSSMAFSPLIDLNLAPGSDTNAPDITAYGRASSDRMGSSIHSSDINGDGVDDLIIGAEWSRVGSPSRSEAGAVYVWFGKSSPTNLLDAAGTTGAPPDLTIWGASGGDHLTEYGTVRVADLNGDGKKDLILGAPRGDGPSASLNDNRGEAYIIFGRAAFPALIDLAVPAADVTTIHGVTSLDELTRGNAIQAADVNGDGITDLLLGTHLGDGPGNSRLTSGEAYVVFGRPVFPALISLATQADVTIYGASASDALCWNGALRVGDVNGDGFADILLGAPQAAGPGDTRPLAGEAYLVLGRTNFPSVLDLSVQGANGASLTIYGEVDHQMTALDGLGLGDLNGDGLADIVLATPFADGPSNTRRNAGGAWIIFGRAGADPFPPTLDVTSSGAGGVDVVIHGATAGDQLNGLESTLVMGDVTGDGVADLVLAARFADGPLEARENVGEVYIVAGRTNFPSVLDLAVQGAGGATVTLYGSVGLNSVGGANKIALGDINGDGVPDLLLGYGELGGNRANVVFGRKPPAVFPTELDMLVQGSNGADITLTVSGFDLSGGPVAGDVNGDGIKDLLLSAPGGPGPGGTRGGAGQAYVVFGEKAATGLSLGLGALNYQLAPAGSGTGGFYIAPGATLSTPAGGLDGGSLTLEITSGYDAAADHFLIGANPDLAGGGFSASAATGTDITLSFQGMPFGMASVVTNRVTCTFNSQVTAASVAALLGNLRYENSQFSADWFTNADQIYPPRTLSVSLAPLGETEQAVFEVISFPTITGLLAPAFRIPLGIVDVDLQEAFVCLTAMLSNGQRVEPDNLGVSWQNHGLPPWQGDMLPQQAKTHRCTYFYTPEFLGRVYTVTASSGSKQVVFTVATVHEKCAVLEFLSHLGPGLVGEGGIQPNRLRRRPHTLVEFSPATFYALEALMRSTTEGTRLADLYRKHTFEVVNVLNANPALTDEMANVLLDFESAILALMSGQGDTVVLPQTLIDGLAGVWNQLKALAGPELQAALQAEQDRLHGFQDLVGKTMAQTAGLNGVAAPLQPFVYINGVDVPAGQVVVTANAPASITPALWRSPNLSDWVLVPGFETETSAGTVRLKDPNPPAGSVFYQIRW
jgi:hypothetical protein